MVVDPHEQELSVHLHDGGFQLENMTIDVGIETFLTFICYVQPYDQPFMIYHIFYLCCIIVVDCALFELFGLI